MQDEALIPNTVYYDFSVDGRSEWHPAFFFYVSFRFIIISKAFFVRESTLSQSILFSYNNQF